MTSKQHAVPVKLMTLMALIQEGRNSSSGCQTIRTHSSSSVERVLHASLSPCVQGEVQNREISQSRHIEASREAGARGRERTRRQEKNKLFSICREDKVLGWAVRRKRAELNRAERIGPHFGGSYQDKRSDSVEELINSFLLLLVRHLLLLAWHLLLFIDRQESISGRLLKHQAVEDGWSQGSKQTRSMRRKPSRTNPLVDTKNKDMHMACEKLLGTSASLLGARASLLGTRSY